MKWFAPECIQTSSMDCGPAALKCVLEGFGVPVGYGRLREACQTDVDGTSIDAIEDVARALGLDAEQHLVPLDHVLLPEAKCFPAIVVLTMPTGLNHFVVLYRRHGPLVQVMDPARGRQWLSVKALESQLYAHPTQVPASAFREYAATPEMVDPLKRRLAGLGIASAGQDALVTLALDDESWASVAALDTAVRVVQSLVASGGLPRGDAAGRLVATVAAQAKADPESIPERFRTVGVAGEEDGETVLWMRGAVVVAVPGLRDATAPVEEGEAAPSEDLARALREPPIEALPEFVRLLRADGLLVPLALVLLLCAGALGAFAEVVLLRGLLDLGSHLQSPGARMAAAATIVGLMLTLALLRLPESTLVKTLGRRLETRVRIEFQTKLPRLPDRYFRSRLISDMAQRSHSLAAIPLMPRIVVDVLAAGFGLLAVLSGLIWLSPRCALLAVLSAALSIATPLSFLPVLSERDYRVRTHLGALAGAYLDSLMGIIAVRSHAAERAFRRQHETLLVEWQRAARELLQASVLVQAAMSLMGFTLAALLVGNYLLEGGGLGGTLLVTYWALAIPQLGDQIARAARTYPQIRSTFMRVLEVLKAPEDPVADGPGAGPARGFGMLREGMAISLAGVEVRGGGTTILSEVDVDIAPGEHVAIVGTSGAGKSSLLSLLLGFHQPAQGSVWVDGAELSPEGLAALRASTAWIDPSVQLWNRSVLENLRYGAEEDAISPGTVLEDAQLASILERLPEGLATQLGEGGGMLSGGEGQRVRAGRAFLRRDVRLALLDEPFRGLDRTARKALMKASRRIFEAATLIAVTHDVRDTHDFERVLVVEGGRVVEDGTPRALLAQKGSRYGALYRDDAALAERLWNDGTFRKIRVQAGQLTELREEAADAAE